MAPIGSAAIRIRQHLAGLLCDGCSERLQPVESPFCSICGIPFESRFGEDHVCGDCLQRPRAFRKARSAGINESVLMSVVHAFKYKGRIRLGRRLGALAFDTLTAFWDRDDLDVVMPVPLHPARCRRRGFNQSRILMRDWPALALARAASWKDLPQVTNAIARRRKTRQQTGLHRRERRENIRGAFSLVSGDAVDGKRVLLVDDVMTTGATVEECARVLRKGGARAVDVLTVARAL